MESNEMKEIALKVVRYKLRKEGVKIDERSAEHAKKVAKELGIDETKFLEFLGILTKELIDEQFNPLKKQKT